ncbi:hypothetical protein [Helicobacter cappadocius]|uniref:Uncharacterized protein n=1 Tax=Helicobacter cappadocius TaxID=3063998 RepID=A0AA90PQH1_9HELI|nr:MULTISPECIES: hypothetical protein [unclassified Helicobacter]MDO7252843.1 hypothetical protein [Helicobacter sp. faydin-H75]MDP2538886.1 hypothetical protein [Helicobacter sp. faydin-H76]
MYDIWFYAFFWLIGMFFAFPICLIGIIWLFFQRPPANEKLTLQSIQIILNTIKTKENFQVFLRKFLKNFVVIPQDEKDSKLWFALVEKIAYCKLLDIDEVAIFRQELENANAGSEKQIVDLISNVLKTRKKG